MLPSNMSSPAETPFLLYLGIASRSAQKHPRLGLCLIDLLNGPQRKRLAGTISEYVDFIHLIHCIKFKSKATFCITIYCESYVILT